MLFLWAVFVPLIFVALPVVLSFLGARLGWHRNAPSLLNLTGTLPLLAGISIAAWALAVHYRAASRGWAFTLDPTPEYFLTEGPYNISRNPMYLGGATAWLGWALLLGSIPTLLGAFLFWGVIALRVVPQEEEALEIRFGGQYDSYKDRVPRWLGRIRPPAHRA